MWYSRNFLSILFGTSLLISGFAHAQQPWSGSIATGRATNWANAGLAGGTPDIPPDSSWAQCGSTVAPYGSSSAYASPSTIQNAIAACGTNQYVLLGAGDFYLTGGVSLKSNMVLRGAGANATRVHINGGSNVVMIDAGNVWSGSCSAYLSLNWWTCPAGQTYSSGWSNSANWVGGYAQGATSIQLDNVTGIVLNQTPIMIDQCDTGFTGQAGAVNCLAGSSDQGGITSATVAAGGSGYSVGDTGTINCSANFGRCYGSGTATYTVTGVSGGAVTGFSVTAPGFGYTYTNTNSDNFGSPATTQATSGSGTGFTAVISGIVGYDNNGLFVCAITMVCTYQSDAGASRGNRSQQEIVVATAITGTGPYTVTISHPLMHPNWSSSQGPLAWWGGATITNAGVENMLLDPSAVTTSSVAITSAYNVWVTGIASTTANFFHVYMFGDSNVLVNNSYFYLTKQYGTESYGVGSVGAIGNSLFENNILEGIVDPLNPDGSCAGCVFAYNFSVNQYDYASDYMFASSPMHAASTDYILEEGNVGAGAALDDVHGPHFFDTFFRNYFTGYESNNGTMPTNDTIPAIVGAFSRYNNFLANVLGTAGYHTVYQCNPASTTSMFCSAYGGSSPGYTSIWDLGWPTPSQRDYSNTPSTPADPLTTTSLYRYGNYDTVSAAVRWNSAEVPTTDPNFPNPVPNSNTFPSSFYNGITGAFPSCGTGLSFWKNPTTGTCPPYPSIGPDVTNGDIGMCTSGTYKWSRALNSSQCAGGAFTASVTGGYGVSNPAMRCYLNQMGGAPDGDRKFAHVRC